MENNSKGIIKIFAGIFCFMLGMTFASTDITGLAVIFFIICAVLIIIGITDLVAKENNQVNFTDQEKIDFAKQQEEAPHNSQSQKEEQASFSPLAYTNLAVNLTILSADEALSNHSKHVNQRATAKLDYTIYVLFSYYCALCNLRNEELVDNFSRLCYIRLKQHFSPLMDENKINRIIDERLEKYDFIMQNCQNKIEAINDTLELYITKDLWFPDYTGDAIPIADVRRQLELRLELIELDKYVGEKVSSIYDKLIAVSNKSSVG